MSEKTESDIRNGRRLRAARERAGFESASQFAKEHGVPPSTYISYENGSRRIPIKKGYDLARILKIDPGQLMEGQPRPTNIRPEPAISPPPLHDMAKDLPVYGQAAGSLLGRGAVAMDGDMGHVRRPPVLAGIKKAYAVYVIGESMEPKYRAGDLIFVNPARPPRPGDAVVIQIRDGEHADIVAYVKVLERFDDRRVVCRQYNPDSTVEYPRHVVVAVHRVLDNNDLFGI